MIELKVGFPDTGGISRVLGVLASAVGDMTPIWQEVLQPWFLEHMAQQFLTSGEHGGQPWARYDTEPWYSLWKKGIVGHTRPLVWQWGGRFERLRPSLMEPDAEYSLARFDPSKASLGTSLPYARELNDGGVGPFGEPFPARKMFAATAGQKKALMTLLQRAILQKLEEAGYGNKAKTRADSWSAFHNTRVNL